MAVFERQRKRSGRRSGRESGRGRRSPLMSSEEEWAENPWEVGTRETLLPREGQQTFEYDAFYSVTLGPRLSILHGGEALPPVWHVTARPESNASKSRIMGRAAPAWSPASCLAACMRVGASLADRIHWALITAQRRSWPKDPGSGRHSVPLTLSSGLDKAIHWPAPQ